MYHPSGTYVKKVQKYRNLTFFVFFTNTHKYQHVFAVSRPFAHVTEILHKSIMLVIGNFPLKERVLKNDQEIVKMVRKVNIKGQVTK